MDIFLHRVLAFPEFVFVITKTEYLESRSLERLLSFLSDREASNNNFTLHLLQRGDVIHRTPWIRERDWDAASRMEDDSANRWVEFLSRGHVESLSIVTSDTCGSGKTRMIRCEIDSLVADGICSNVICLPIHQQTTTASLINALQKRIRGTNGATCALYLSFTFLPCREHEQQLSQLNHFLFSILAFGHVYDPASKSSLSLRQSRWYVFVEIPAPRESETSRQWLRRCLPILPACGELETPKQGYEIDVMARRVSVYLRAYKTGTINRKFEGGAQKRLVLVLDCSGSMAGQPYNDAVANALSIFESHVIDGDVSTGIRILPCL